MKLCDYIYFYIKNNPYFTDIKKINESFVCTNHFGTDYDCNCAFLFDDSKKQAEAHFKKLGKTPVFYNFRVAGLDFAEKLEGYEIYHADLWLTAKVSALSKKFALFKCPSSITLERVDESNYAKQNEISNAGFSAVGEDNPYSDVDLADYSNSLKLKFDNSKNDELVIFLLNFKGESVGVINLNIEGETCYIAGFTIKPEYRRTRLFFALKLVLNFLKKKGVKNILCITENDGYPGKIYQKLGFTPLCVADIYKKK